MHLCVLGIAQGALERKQWQYSQQRNMGQGNIVNSEPYSMRDGPSAVHGRKHAAFSLQSNQSMRLRIGLFRLEANLAKCFANQMVRDVTGLALQIHGATAIPRTIPLNECFVMVGPGCCRWDIQIQKVTIASQLLNRRY